MRRQRIVFLAVVVVLASSAVPAAAVHHSMGGIRHGIHVEVQAGDNYHHAWTAHSHGYKYVAIYECSGFACQGAGHEKCYSDNYVNTSVDHVHCTAYFEGLGYTWHDVNKDTSGTGCFGYDQPAPFYKDAHGMCAHEMDEWQDTFTDPTNEGDLLDWLDLLLEGYTGLPPTAGGEDVGLYGTGLSREIGPGRSGRGER